MNRFFVLFLFFSFLAPINIVQAMENDVFEDVKGQFRVAVQTNNRQQAQVLHRILCDMVKENPRAANWMKEEGWALWESFSAPKKVPTPTFHSPPEQPYWFKTRQQFLEAIQQDNQIEAQNIYSFLMTIAQDITELRAWLDAEGATYWQLYRDSCLAQQFSQPNVINHYQPNVINYNYDTNHPQYRVNLHPEVKQLREDFAPIKAFIRDSAKSKQGTGVHFMDDFYGAQEGTLVRVADALFPENGRLSLEELKVRLKQLLTDRPNLLDGYTYQGTRVTREVMNGYIDQVYQPDMPVKLCSHAFNLSLQTSKAFGNNYFIDRLFDAIAENYLTKGGCIQGRRDRQFVVLSSMLVASGL